VKRNARNSTHSRSSASGLCSRYRLAAEPPGDFTLFVTLWRKSIARCSPTCRKLPRGETPGKFTRKNSWRPFNPNLVLHKSLPSPANEFAAPNSLNPALAAQIQSLQSDFASVGAVSNCLASATAWHHRRACPERGRRIASQASVGFLTAWAGRPPKPASSLGRPWGALAFPTRRSPSVSEGTPKKRIASEH
jgi:hypothetical protein